MKPVRIPLRVNKFVMGGKPMWMRHEECRLKAGDKLDLLMPWGVSFAVAKVVEVKGPFCDGPKGKKLFSRVKLSGIERLRPKKR